VVKPNRSNESVFTIYQSNWRFLEKEVSPGSDTTCKESDDRSPPLCSPGGGFLVGYKAGVLVGLRGTSPNRITGEF
jgi:hypothetical protein